jgi:Flp pilus assembly protein TadB
MTDNQDVQIVPDAIKKELLQVTAVHFNVAQEFIMITEDKTYRCLREWKDNIEARNAWIAPLTLLAPLVLAFVTANFKDALGISKNTWQAVFLIGIVLAALWALREIVKRMSRKANPQIEELIRDLKKGAVVQHTAVNGVTSTTTIQKN